MGGQLVGQGVKMNKGLKEVHLDSVARDVTEYSGQPCTSNQVYNDLSKWRARWIKVHKLKELSGAGWDEQSNMITLEESQYKAYVQSHPKDAEFLNRPIVNYMPMQIILGSSVATGQPSEAPTTIDVHTF